MVDISIFRLYSRYRGVARLAMSVLTLAILVIAGAAGVWAETAEEGEVAEPVPPPPEFRIHSFRLFDENGDRTGFIQPGDTFTVTMRVISLDPEREHAFAELQLWHGSDLLSLRGERVAFANGEGEITASFVAPPDVEKITVYGSAARGRAAAPMWHTEILVGERTTRYEPQRLLIRGSDFVELFQGDRYTVDNHVVVYQHFHGIHQGTRIIPYHQILVGAHDVVLSTLHDRVVQIDVLSPQYVEYMRVGIMDGNFSSLAHSHLTLSSSTGLVVENARGQLLTRTSPGLPLEFHVTEGKIHIQRNGEPLLQTGERLFLHAAYGGMIRVDSFQRGGSTPFHPEYRGVFELTPSGSDHLQVVNELPMDEYLYQVLPSEMPASWPLEALKAQAVAARTYAVREAMVSRYAHRGFHVDDSTQSQVYNNQREASKANNAIDLTSPYIMRSADDNAVVYSLYHSSSAGVTARASQVWSTEDGRFPGSDYPYLQARSVLPQFTLPESWSEDFALEFFQRTDLSGFDDASPWFRWNVKLTGEQLSRTINTNLPTRWHAQPDFVLTRTDDGTFASLPIPEEGIGAIRLLEVVERGDGGNIMSMDIYGEHGVIRVLKEFNIRFLLRPAAAFTGSDVTLDRMGSGTNLVNYSVLPSAFMAFEQKHNGEGLVSEIHFFGGGNGHGVGMSQWAARAMAEEGRGFEDILRSFYTDIRLTPLQMEYR